MFSVLLTDEQLYASGIEDVIIWADEIAGEWNGDESGSQEDRAHQAIEIIEKAKQLKELIEGMEEL
jgi:hypothetical protein